VIDAYRPERGYLSADHPVQRGVERREAHMPEVTSKEIRPCECGQVVAWLEGQPYEIKRDISTEADGTRTVIVSTEDIHYCGHYSGLAGLIRTAIDRSWAQEGRIRLPAAEPFVLSWNRGEREAKVSNGRAGENCLLYGSLNRETGGYRVRRPSSSLRYLLEQIDHNPLGYDWSAGGTQTYCCFCNCPLNDPRSVKWGYGPTCAENYGLRWG